MDVPVGPAVVTIYADDEVMVSQPDARMSSAAHEGYFVADTRLVSGYRLQLAGRPPVLLNSSEIEHYSSRFEFTNDEAPTMAGTLPAGVLRLRVDRTVDGGVHEDYDLVSYHDEPVDLELEVGVESDFADIFEVKSGSIVRRGSMQSAWDEEPGALTTRYHNRGFERAIRLQVENGTSRPQFANGSLLFRVRLEPRGGWHTCLLWLPWWEGRTTKADLRPCNQLVGALERDVPRRRWLATTTRFSTSSRDVTTAVEQAVRDLASLRISFHDRVAGAREANRASPWVPAAGVPWFMTLFGRDALVASLQTLALSPRFALGSLRALGALQADEDDPSRDMEPGKILHEIRSGELATLDLVPHRPYYGTHDATALYVWTAAEAWRWHGDRDALDALRAPVERCLAWIDRSGDLDGDGLQEYSSRAGAAGYRNQGWKDAGDAIVHADGSLAPLPVALCENQAYVVAAKRAWAGVLDDVYGEHLAAARLRAEAERLADLVEDRFWWEDAGTYCLGLDGDKRRIESVASNPGHLLWACAVVDERARLVADRLLAPDMWSGWGIRTLSCEHPAYNPYSYQLGSVWPHDNAVAAAGFYSYGLDAAAQQVARGMLEAAARFQANRLPELFAGLERDDASFPVQYLGANVPQAWAAGAVVHLLSVLLGLTADAAHDMLSVSPALPDWLPVVRLENLRVAGHVVDLEVRRRPDGNQDVTVTQRQGRLQVEHRVRERPASGAVARRVAD